MVVFVLELVGVSWCVWWVSGLWLLFLGVSYSALGPSVKLRGWASGRGAGNAHKRFSR